MTATFHPVVNLPEDRRANTVCLRFDLRLPVASSGTKITVVTAVFLVDLIELVDLSEDTEDPGCLRFALRLRTSSKSSYEQFLQLSV